MERGNYSRGRGRGSGGGDDRGRGGSRRGGGRRGGDHHQQQHYNQYQGGGRGERGSGPSYASTVQQASPPLPAQQWAPPRPAQGQPWNSPRPAVQESGYSSGRGVWGLARPAIQESGDSSGRGAWRPRPAVQESGGSSPRGAWGSPRPAVQESGESSVRGAWGGSGRGWRPSIPTPAQSPAPDPPVEGFQSLQMLEQPAAASPVRTRSNLLPVRRPDKGGINALWHLKLLVNHFPVKFKEDTMIIHYDIDIKLEDAPKSHSKKIPKPHLRMIKDKLFFDDPAKFPLLKTAYDGEKNIFSAVELGTGKFSVYFSLAEDKNRSCYTVTITEVNKLEFRKLKDYLCGKVLSIPRDILQGMDLVMKENPSRCRFPVGRSFFPTSFSKENDLDGGITASKGFQQSLKPTTQGLALCLDYSVLAFHKRLPLLDFLKERVSGFREVNDVNRLRRNVTNALTGLKVTVTHRVTKQKYTIAGLTVEDTRKVTFDVEDPAGKAQAERVNVVKYFKDKYNKDIMHKDIPCLDLGKNNRKNYVPMEFCILLEGQRYPKESLSRDGAILLKNMSLAPPKDRMKTICEMVRANDGPCGGDIAKNFGMQVDMNMTRVEARVIGPPILKVGAPNGNKKEVKIDNEKCQWNLVGKSVVVGKPLERWALLDFSARARYRLDPDNFIWNLKNRCQKLGIHVEDPLVYHPTDMSPFSDIKRLHNLLETVKAEANEKGRGRLQIMVCVMAYIDPGYKTLKWLSETKIGILTQCCLVDTVNRGNDQNLANIYLKINAKLGGSNVELSDHSLPDFEGEGHVMFVGADVNHPAAQNSTCPSIAAVVASVNWPAANRYAARVLPQYHRKEKITNFGTMCLELIQAYALINKVKPQRIVIFRDGVSEGQFDMVVNEELIDIKKAIYEEYYRPTITVVVAQKRHQTRLFPEPVKDGGSKGNVPPGTVVDTIITHPFEFDFYLCSHYGSLGTSKPTHYYVLWDEHKFTSDKLQKLIYDLCFTFARCTKPVSLVPPVYYADLVAYRGRMFQEVVMNFPPSLASTSSAASLDYKLYKLHPDLENIMFFV